MAIPTVPIPAFKGMKSANAPVPPSASTASAIEKRLPPIITTQPIILYTVATALKAPYFPEGAVSLTAGLAGTAGCGSRTGCGIATGNLSPQVVQNCGPALSAPQCGHLATCCCIRNLKTPRRSGDKWKLVVEGKHHYYNDN